MAPEFGRELLEVVAEVELDCVVGTVWLGALPVVPESPDVEVVADVDVVVATSDVVVAVWRLVLVVVVVGESSPPTTVRP